MSLYKKNTATFADVEQLFQNCAFDPPLESYTDVPAYIKKILAHAQRFECWVDGELAGLVAIYCNDTKTRKAFITMVCVLPKYTGRGIAKELLNKAIAHSKEDGFTIIGLEVTDNNLRAVEIYKKLGFAVEGRRGHIIDMTLTLAGKT